MRMPGLFQRGILLITVVLFLGGCQTDRSTGGSRKILFIGNSLTYFNDQPEIFQTLADSAGRDVTIDERTVGGWQMSDHHDSEATHQKIEEREWDTVILQEAVFQVAFSEYHAILGFYVETLMDLIAANNPATEIMYFLTWALKEGVTFNNHLYPYGEAQEMLYTGTKQFAVDLEIEMAPVGWAWKFVIDNRPDIELFDADGEHPSYAGSYLGACVYYTLIFGESVAGNPFTGDCSPDVAAYLQTVASETVFQEQAL